MANDNGNTNVLYELAQALPAGHGYLTAMALRQLARHGFTSLAQVEGASDWELLALNGIGPERLAAIRRLTRPDWQPPSTQAISTAQRLLATAQLALRFWRVEDLEATLAGADPRATDDGRPESRLSMDAFASAVREASEHHAPDLLRQILQRASTLVGHNAKTRRKHGRI